MNLGRPPYGLLMKCEWVVRKVVSDNLLIIVEHIIQTIHCVSQGGTESYKKKK